ncbi:hypothetical protein M0R04_07700 [Candidatus Dojkabacteria bacterium]|jgi:hypothetical protein|nr:hypothetical protein [Candidatus Dojkabacteria bacterium]
MKLIEVAKLPVDWNTKSEKQQIAMVRRKGHAVTRIANPSEAVQLAAIRHQPWAVVFLKNPTLAAQKLAVKLEPWQLDAIKNPDPAIIRMALTDIRFIQSPSSYIRTVNWLFKDNDLLMKKWLRYGETMRNQE